MEEKAFAEVFAEVPLPPGGGQALVRKITISENEDSMEVEAYDPASNITPLWVTRAETTLMSYFGMQRVVLRVHNMREVKPPERKKTQFILGKQHGKNVVALEELGDSEQLSTVTGRVIGMQPKLYERRFGEVTFWFDIANSRGSARIEARFPAEEAKKQYGIVSGLLKKESWVTVTGRVQFKPQREEYLFAPNAISVAEPPAQREDDCGLKRVELHLHTKMSAKDATSDVSKVVATAARWGHPAVAITDHGVCHSFPEAALTAAKCAKSGSPIKVIYGCEGYMPAGEGRRNYHIILLAATQTGLKNLYTLVSKAHIDHFYKRPRIPRELLSEYREGLIIGSACEAGDLFRAVVEKRPRGELLEIASFYDYLEIQPVCNNAFMIRNGSAADYEALRDYNRAIVSLGDELGLPVCATGDVHFLEPEDEIYRKVLLNSMDMDHGEPLPLYLKTTGEMLEEFAYLGEDKAREVVVDNPQLIASRCEPLSPVRSGEYFPRIEASAEELKRLSVTRAHELYGEKLPKILEERMEIELNSIIKKGYDIIYMIAQKLVLRSLEEGYLVGSRGSVGSSIVAYLSGITEVNSLPAHYRCGKCLYSEFSDPPPAACGADLPDKFCPVCGEELIKDGFDIPFATFLGFEADKKPDIDLNFSGEYQARAHAHTVELFGESKVFRAGTISTLAEKNAIGYALKYLKDERRFPAEVTRHARGCVGVKSTTGQHPGGLIVLPQDKDIYEFCPVQYPADKSESMITTHFDYHAIEENLLKLDLLGHDDPTVLRMLEDLTGVPVRSIPLDDRDTMSIFKSSEALGFKEDKLLGPTGAVAVPEFGTRFVRGMLVSTQPTTFDELVRISGLSHGTDVWLGNAEPLVAEGKATLREVICARDDIMIYLISRGMERKLAFTIMESVRKGKGLTPDWEAAMRGAQVPEWYIQSCHKIKYMFPKAHAAAYVVMAFRIAWFKVHRPLEFYAAFFSVRAVQFDVGCCCAGRDAALKRIREIEENRDATDAEKNQIVTLEVCYEFYTRGFSFAPLDIFTSDAVNFIPLPDGRLLPPLVAVPGLGEVAARDIVTEREKEEFCSIEDVALRCKVNKNHIDTLMKNGAFGDLPKSSQLSLF